MSITFRAKDRTLTQEEVHAQMDIIVRACQKEHGAYVPGYVFQSGEVMVKP